MDTLPADETFAIIGPGNTYETVTRRISQIVLTNRVSLGWLAGITLGLVAILLA